jgi:hypothetical protein
LLGPGSRIEIKESTAVTEGTQGEGKRRGGAKAETDSPEKGEKRKGGGRSERSQALEQSAIPRPARGRA